MHASSLDSVIKRAEAAISIPDLRRCLVDTLLIVAQLNGELDALRTRKPAIAEALSNFQTKHKDRSARR